MRGTIKTFHDYNDFYDDDKTYLSCLSWKKETSQNSHNWCHKPIEKERLLKLTISLCSHQKEGGRLEARLRQLFALRSNKLQVEHRPLRHQKSPQWVKNLDTTTHHKGQQHSPYQRTTSKWPKPTCSAFLFHFLVHYQKNNYFGHNKDKFLRPWRSSSMLPASYRYFVYPAVSATLTYSITERSSRDF